MPSGSGRPWGRLRLHKDGSKKPMDQTTELSKAKAFIGRKRSCDVVAKTKTVSGVHCAIHRVDMPKGDYKVILVAVGFRRVGGNDVVMIVGN
eukprot:1341267-Amorphochlora_amoeboformis.AAC.1